MSERKPMARLFVSAIRSGIDEQFTIQLHTNQPLKKFRIEATTEDDKRNMFRSSAAFYTNEHGIINLSKQAPIAGDYEGVDSMGLIWSMRSVEKKEGRFVKHSSDPIKIRLHAYDNDQLVDSQSIIRTFYPVEEVVKESIANESILGTTYSPKQPGKYPAVIVVGGSDGAVHEAAAAMLAAQGYVVLALAYFGREGLPKGIENIPLEYVDHAFQYLESKTNVDHHNLGMIGFSRGAELTLLYALHYPKLKSVIAVAPSAVVFSGVVNFQPIDAPAWTFKGKPLKYFKAKRTLGDTATFFYHWIFRKPYSGLPSIHRNLQDTRQLEDNAIAVENIHSPMMFLSGRDDHVQPAEFFTKRMEQRLSNHPFHELNEYIYYEDAGHFAAFPGSLPNLPQTVGDTNYNMTMIFGGTRRANAKAALESWEHTLKFLDKTLKGHKIVSHNSR
ncbi:acyl-CoA thioesterase/bile acid-CoA:amino acid N-acyltransferase family protein [Paenibacillus sp. FSL W7-1287]|uniref:acyl-CoA thioesterase/bile acid-CoA:amino acid N-acyltransferase family protein n=1 Tax=Paenibacillus sp. FSL W7-1287 TaxID=2954538 RepID=UPI0030F8DAC3